MSLTKKEFALAWLAALRGGEYKQGTGELQSIFKGVPHYCCLGVACDIALRNDVDIGNNYDEQCKIRGHLPDKWFKDFGPKSTNEDQDIVVSHNNVRDVVSYINDNGVPFTKIANLIAAEYVKDGTLSRDEAGDTASE